MYSKAFAAEYQGALRSMSVNSSLSDVLAKGTEQLREAKLSGSQQEVARSGLAVAEAHRRLGHVKEADRAWKASYRTARSVGMGAVERRHARPSARRPGSGPPPSRARRRNGRARW
jgi:hypothetical protein